MTRLIDADKAIAQEKQYAEEFKGDFGEQVSVHAIEILVQAPTVDAIPVEWLEMTYPLHGVSGTEAYLRNASAVKDILRNWELSKRYAQETKE